MLATNRTDLDQVLSIYKTRWSIETAFGFFKSRGFNLEETHLTQPKRIELLLAVLALCFMELANCNLAGSQQTHQNQKPWAESY